jgi:antiviral helicase SKI2
MLEHWEEGKNIARMALQEGFRTAGVIVREGVSGGQTPSIQVLEIGRLGHKRHPSDILPFLPMFKHLLQTLPTC